MQAELESLRTKLKEAEDNDVNTCGGNSQSFIEGCEEYLEEKEEQRRQEDESEEQDY